MKASSALRGLAAGFIAERIKRGENDPATARNYAITLDQLADTFGGRPVDRFGQRAVERLFEQHPDWSPGTRARKFSEVRQFADYLERRGHIRRNPCRDMKAPRRPRTVPKTLPRDEVGEILAHAPDARARVVILLMIQEVCRRVEVSRLEVGDVDLEHQTIRLVGKAHHERVVHLTAQTAQAIRVYLRETGATAGKLIRSKVDPTAGITPRACANIMTGAAYAAGVKVRGGDGVAPHVLRKTGLTDMLRAGAKQRDVQAAAGHANLSSLEPYVALVLDGVEAAMGGRQY